MVENHMTLKTYEEMDESQRLAYRMGRKDALDWYGQWLDGYPDLYEIPESLIPHMKALGIMPRRITNERLVAIVLKNLDHEAAEAAFAKWMDLDVIHIEYHREATGGGPVEAILAAAQKGKYA